MYKVFFNDRKVFLGGHDEIEDLACLRSSTGVEKQEEVEGWVNRFLMDTSLEELVLSYSDEELLFEWFSSCFERIHAAGGLVGNSRKELLCIRRLGYWDLPKGKAEKGESPEQTALREVEEECGINHLSIEKYATTSYHIYSHPKKEGKWVLKNTDWFFIYYPGDQTPVPQLSEAIEEVIWASITKVEEIKLKTYASLMPIFELWLNSLWHSR